MGPIWDPSGQPAYGLTHMGPMPNPVALPIWVPYGTHKGMFAGSYYEFGTSCLINLGRVLCGMRWHGPGPGGGGYSHIVLYT